MGLTEIIMAVIAAVAAIGGAILGKWAGKKQGRKEGQEQIINDMNSEVLDNVRQANEIERRSASDTGDAARERLRDKGLLRP